MPGKACLAVCSIVLAAYPKLEARGLIGELLKECNLIRPYSELGNRPSAPEAIMPVIMPVTLTSKVV